MPDDDAPRDGTPSPPAGGEPRPDGPAAERSAGEPGLDQTAEYNPLAETTERPPGDETQAAGAPGTGVPPPVTDATPRWSARAQVPTPQYDEGPEWQELEQPPRRGLLVPVLIALCVLLLAALIGLGVWLALRNRETTPVTPPSETTSAAPTTTGATATSQPPTTSAAPTTPAPVVPVEIPQLAGRTYQEAVDELEKLGFSANRVDQPSTEVPAGRVIGTQPAAGGRLLPPATVNVIVSSGAPTTAAPSPS